MGVCKFLGSIQFPIAVVLSLWGLLVSGVPSGFAAESQFRAGANKGEITPQQFPIRTAGNLVLTEVTEVADPLHVRSLVLDDGATTLSITLVDLCMLDRATIDEIKEQASEATGIPTKNMLVASTHTHTAPAVYSCHGNDAELRYLAEIKPKIADSIERAWRNLEPAQVAWGKENLPKFVHCRRWIMKPGTADNPDADFTGQKVNDAMMNPGYANPNKIKQTSIVDPEVTVLSVKSADGRPIAVLGNYSTHYASAPAQKLSADYFGVFCDLLEKKYRVDDGRSKFVAIMSNGTSGDANPIDFTKENWVSDYKTVAQAVADVTMNVLDKMEYHKQAPLSCDQRLETFRTRRPTSNQVAKARDYLASKVGNRPTRNWEENYARETTLMEHWPENMEIVLQTMKIGDFALGAIPNETHSITGIEIKKASSAPVTMVIGLANGYHGYLPPPDQFELGGYCTWRARSSYLEKTAEPRIRSVVQQMMAARSKN